MSDLFGDDSEDDTLGQEREKLLCKDSKFSDMYTDKVRSFVKADKLLPEEMSSLCSNLESLLLYSASKSISELSWSEFSKQIFWTACSLSFFTACRMGEIVPALERSLDPATTLTWDNVVFPGK